MALPGFASFSTWRTRTIRCADGSSAPTASASGLRACSVCWRRSTPRACPAAPASAPSRRPTERPVLGGGLTNRSVTTCGGLPHHGRARSPRRGRGSLHAARRGSNARGPCAHARARNSRARAGHRCECRFRWGISPSTRGAAQPRRDRVLLVSGGDGRQPGSRPPSRNRSRASAGRTVRDGGRMPRLPLSDRRRKAARARGSPRPSLLATDRRFSAQRPAP